MEKDYKTVGTERCENIDSLYINKNKKKIIIIIIINSWMQEVTRGLREKGINNMKWIDRE